MRYLQRLCAGNDGCHYLISEIEDAIKRVQARLAFCRYRAPILVGTGMGAALVYAALTQSPAATVEGSARDGFTTVLDTKVPLCPGAAASAVPGGYAYAPARELPGWWRLAATKGEMADAGRFYREASLDSADIVEIVEGTGVADRFVMLLQEPIDALRTRRLPISDLPIVELDAADAGRYFAVIFSGDGG